MAAGRPVDDNGPPCYFPNIRNRQEVVEALKPFAHSNGVYLIRNSTTEENSYTLSLTHRYGIRHKRVMVHKNNTFSIESKNEFHSMGALLAHYKTNDIPNEEKIKKFRLLRPLTVLGDGTKGKTITIPQEIPDIYAVPHKPSPAPRSRNVVGRRDARSIDNNDEDADLNPDGILSPEVLNKRPPAPLPAMTEEDTPTYDSHYYYIVPDEECNRLPELRKLLELDEDMRKRCTCGLLSADSHLPDGWEVHLSTDTSTKGRIFFVSPDGRSHWNLPVSIYKKLSDEQREYLSDLFAKDKTRTKATERVSTC